MLRAFINDERGNSAAEYALIVCLVGVGMGAASISLGDNVGAAMDNADNGIDPPTFASAGGTGSGGATSGGGVTGGGSAGGGTTAGGDGTTGTGTDGGGTATSGTGGGGGGGGGNQGAACTKGGKKNC